MNEIMLNDRTVTVSMKRIDLCNLMLACTNTAQRLEASGESAQKWRRLHEHLRHALEAFDKEQGY